MSLPPSVVIVSEPPISDPTEVTRPSVIGWPKRGTSSADGADVARVAEDDVVAAARVDRVAVDRIRDDVPRDVGRARDLAVHDQLAVLAADDDVVPVAGRDVVAAAVIRVDRPDPVDVGGVEVVARERAAALGRRPVDRAGVAEDDVVAVTGDRSCRRRCRR